MCVNMTDDELSKSGDIPRDPHNVRARAVRPAEATQSDTTETVIIPWAVETKYIIKAAADFSLPSCNLNDTWLS